MVFLMETKQLQQGMEVLRRRLGFDHGDYVDPLGRSGGLALWWKKELDVQICRKTKNYIDAKIREKHEWHFTGIYVSPKKNEKAAILEEIYQLLKVQSEPWVVVGDFNLCLSTLDKQGGNGISCSQSSLFQQFINDYELMDLDFKGGKFTWHNH